MNGRIPDDEDESDSPATVRLFGSSRVRKEDEDSVVLSAAAEDEDDTDAVTAEVAVELSSDVFFLHDGIMITSAIINRVIRMRFTSLLL